MNVDKYYMKYKQKLIEKLENARMKYQIAIDKNISESDILWSRFNAMLTFNGIFIALIGFIYKEDLNMPILPSLLPILGLMTCYLWYSVTYRGFRWIEFWIVRARRIEEEYLSDDCSELNPIQKGNEEHQNHTIPFISTETCANLMIGIITIIYSIIFIFNTVPKIESTLYNLFTPSIFYIIR